MPFFTMKLQIIIEINDFELPAINKVICCGNLMPNFVFTVEQYLNKNVTIEQEFF